MRMHIPVTLSAESSATGIRGLNDTPNSDENLCPLLQPLLQPMTLPDSGTTRQRTFHALMSVDMAKSVKKLRAKQGSLLTPLLAVLRSTSKQGSPISCLSPPSPRCNHAHMQAKRPPCTLPCAIHLARTPHLVASATINCRVQHHRSRDNAADTVVIHEPRGTYGHAH